MEDLFTAFHEMGHVYYYLQYQNQPDVYREGANPGEKYISPILIAAAKNIQNDTFNEYRFS